MKLKKYLRSLRSRCFICVVSKLKFKKLSIKFSKTTVKFNGLATRYDFLSRLEYGRELVAASMNKTVEIIISKPTSSGGVQTFLKHMQFFQSFFLQSEFNFWTKMSRTRTTTENKFSNSVEASVDEDGAVR